MADEKKGLEDFLNKVEEIEGLVKDLTSAKDGNSHDEAILKADEYLDQFGPKVNVERLPKKYPPHDNTGVNRTVINDAACKDDLATAGPSVQPGMSQEAFLNAMEADAKERSDRRQKKEKNATLLKNHGNDYFNKGEYHTAVEYYTKALDEVKDMSAVWTNRAQAYIRLEEFDKALEDCEWALKVSERCLKAYIHRGKAYLGKQQYEKAVDSYHQAKKIDPKKGKVIDGYISEARRLQESFEAESRAAEAWNSGSLEARGVVEVMEKLKQKDMQPLYYSGGLRILAKALNGTTEKTLFRSHGGLDLMNSHSIINKCFRKDQQDLMPAEIDVAVVLLDTLMVACTDNETNCCELLDKPEVPNKLSQILTSSEQQLIPLRGAALNLLHTISVAEPGRMALVKKFDMQRVLLGLFDLMKLGGSVAVTAAGFLNNLALCKRFQAQLKEDIDRGVIPAWEKLLMEGASNSAVLPPCVSIMTNLCSSPVIRRKLVARKETWEACCHILETYASSHTHRTSSYVIYEVLGLVLNLTYEQSQNARDTAPRLCNSCLKLLSSNTEPVKQRSLATLAHLLPSSEEATCLMCDSGLIPKLFDIIQTENDQMKDAVRCLCACSQHNVRARSSIVSNQAGVQQLAGLVKHKDEVVVGNAALCLSNCSTEEGLAASLVESNIIMELLVVARDGRKHAAQHNCAILIAKLAQAHPSHLQKLRDLHGLGILHDVLKHGK